ncbi:probable calcium-binding protein CML45 [Cannabis sativa]|nr:probable calcium-binding protein CML45 [Cannabis sativa]
MVMKVFMAKYLKDYNILFTRLMMMSFVIMVGDFVSILRYILNLIRCFICSNNMEYYEKQLSILDQMVATKAMLLNKTTMYDDDDDDDDDGQEVAAKTHPNNNKLVRFGDAKSEDTKMYLGDVKRIMMEELELLESSDGGETEEGDDGGEEVKWEELREAFGVFDENRDGFIDAKEVKKVLFELGIMEPSEAECQAMITTFDKNQDGKINFEEFLEIIAADAIH